MACGWKGSSGELMALASGLSILLARGQESEDIGRMAAFFTLLGDSLALLALQPPGTCPAPSAEGDTDAGCQRAK